ncbi:MAG: Sulfite reductase [NADPH] flavoprotein alpha-component [Chlamydiae bacterium]|nr:Sulfite reductase [NADPH] flavoprotein alpha-component [Chlamydiota bacterium]
MSFDKNNPFVAKITNRHVLNKPGSKKCTVHLSLDISGSGIHYKVGDSVAVFPENSHVHIQKMLQLLNFSGQEKIKDSRSDQEYSIRDFLAKKSNISKVTKKWIVFALDKVKSAEEKNQIESLLKPENKAELKAYLECRQLWDFLAEFKTIETSPQDFADKLTPLLPRFYSIASSQKEHPHAIDLLIAYFHYSSNEHLRYGVASHYLCEAAEMRTPNIPLYLHPSQNFTLPKDPNTPIIMVGPGTGLAPFRGFMQERIATKSPGKNWLFFGDWNQEFDFFYEDYWRDLESSNQLKLSYAFSRDQDRKYYVQDKMSQSAKELFEWLEEGAYFFVCGDAQHMAKDVDQMLHHIIEEEGNLSADGAKLYVKTMKTDGRYLRDVY